MMNYSNQKRNMKKLMTLVAVIATTLLALTACGTKTETANEVNNFRIKRGTNLSHWLSQNNEDRGEARRLHIQEDDFARLDSLGFDFVRIPIDEVQFWDEDGNKLPEAWDLLTFALDQCNKYHLRAIVDLHIIRSHYFNAVNEEDQAANTLFTSEKSQQDLINLWYQLSDYLKGYSNELRNHQISEGARGRQEHRAVVPLLQPDDSDPLRCMVGSYRQVYG